MRAWRVEYDDVPGESWSDWSLYQEYPTEEQAQEVFNTLITQRQGTQTILRIVMVHTVMTKTVIADTSVKPLVIQELP